MEALVRHRRVFAVLVFPSVIGFQESSVLAHSVWDSQHASSRMYLDQLRQVKVMTGKTPQVMFDCQDICLCVLMDCLLIFTHLTLNTESRVVSPATLSLQ